MDKKDLLNTHTFAIDITVPSGTNFKGSFTVHRPAIGERIRIGVAEGRELQGLANVDFLTSNLAHILATLEVVVDACPVWWKPRELFDLEVVQVVYDKYVDYLLEFKEILNKNLKQLADNEYLSLNRWFRKKYHLSPHDPAYLTCEQWEIEMEYLMEEKEIEQIENSRKIPNVCPECGEPIDGNICRKCGEKGLKEKYFDPDYEKYEKEIEKKNEEFFKDSDDWEEVKD